MVSKCKRILFGMLACMMVLANVIFFASATNSMEVYAMEDNIGGGDEFGGTISEDDLGVGDWIKNRRGMTSEQLDTASRTLTPITNMVGYFVGGCIVVVFAGVFVMTGLDLIYIVIPPFRNLLYKGGQQQGGAMGGMGGGYGGHGRFGGMMGGMGGQQQGGQETPIQWISDEAVYCASLLAGGQQPQGGGGMMGGGMYGGGMMGGMGGGQQQPMPMKSVIAMYFKKRVFFMILLAVTAIILTSSALLGTGVNLAQWLLKLIDMVNGYVPQ